MKKFWLAQNVSMRKGGDALAKGLRHSEDSICGISNVFG